MTVYSKIGNKIALTFEGEKYYEYAQRMVSLNNSSFSQHLHRMDNRKKGVPRMQRNGFFRIMIFGISLFGVGLWFYNWVHRLLLFWGIHVDIWLVVLSLIAAIIAIGFVLIKPIPIKAQAIAVLYLLLFGLLTDGILNVLAHILPTWQHGLETLKNSGLLPVLLTIMALLYAYLHGKKIMLTHYDLPVSGPLTFDHLRIALISDVHMGFSIDQQRLQTAVTQMSAWQPDLLVIAGDLVDDQTSLADMQAACRILGAASTRYGVWFCYGNHDLAQQGRKPPFSRDQLDQALTSSGIHILDDQCMEIPGVLTLAGRHDAAISGQSPRLPLKQLLSQANPDQPIILVDHQPLEQQQAIESGVLLHLSGHTHGGQVWPANWLVPLLKPHSLLYGCRQIGSGYAVVSSGLGNRGSRLRSGCSAELVCIELIHTRQPAKWAVRRIKAVSNYQ